MNTADEADEADVGAARSHQAAIDALWDWDDPGGSETRFRAAADEAGEPARSILLTQVARAIGLAGRGAQALAVLDVLPDSSGGELAVRRGLERGRVLNSSGDPAAARPLFEATYEAAAAAGLEHLAVDALHMVASVADPAEQDEINERALALAESAADPRARQWRASLLNNIGWSAFERGEHDAALALFGDALEARLELGKQREILIARWSVARTLRALGRVDEALTIQLELAAAHEAAGTSDPYVDEEIAACRAALA